MFRLKLILWCLLALCLMCASAQTAQGQTKPYGISPSTPLEDCSIDQWTGENGLLSNNLTSAIQASTGFLWITTNNGLMRFDGVNLKIFDQHELPFLGTDAFYRVYEDNRNTLWFASRGSGIIRYVGERFEQFLPDHPGVPKSLRTLLVQKDGTIWAGSDNKGLVVIRDTSVVRIDHPLIRGLSILSLDQDESGTIFIGTNKGLFLWRNQDITPLQVNGRVDHYITAIKWFSGSTFVGTPEGLFKVEGEKTTRIEFLDGIQVNHISIDQFNSIWIATERGLARLNEDASTSQFLPSGRSFSGAHITSVFPDREGSIWMTTGKSGLLRMKESPIRNYNENHGLSVDRVNAITEAPDGKFYVSLDDGQINVFDKGRITQFSIKQPKWNESVRDVLVEEDGTIWICSYKGIIRKRSTVEKWFTTEDGLSSTAVRRVFRDSKNRLWFITRTGGVMQFRADNDWKIYNRASGLSSDYILSIEEDSKGNLWVGTHSGGLNVIRADGSTEVFHLRSDDDGVLIFNLHVDEHDNVFLATSVGLYHFDQETHRFTRIRLREYIKGESFFDWVEDRRGNVWITSNIGILQFRKEDVNSFLEGKLLAVRTKVFNDYDGMKNKECTGATRSTLSSDGEIWVPTIGGVCVVNPAHLRDNSIVPPVYITEVFTDRDSIEHPAEGISVEPGNFRITFNFTSLSLLAPNKVRFKYKLEKIDEDWKRAEPLSRSVDYTNLEPGKYTFHVIASNNDGIWNEQGASLPLTIKPYFYQTSLFYVIALFVFSALFLILYKWRVSAIEHKNVELQKVNTELDRFVYSASHDLRAPLTSVLGLVRLTRLDSDPANREHYLELIEKSIHKLDGFIHDIINYSRNARTEVESRRVSFEPFINEIIESLRYQDKGKLIRKNVDVVGKGEFFTDIKRLEIAMFNLIANAIKYHDVSQHDPFITVKVEYDEKNAVIEVIDNGRGIDRQHLQDIFKMFYRADETSTGSGLGLFIASEAIEKISGNISVKSTVGKGSTFRIQIPSLKPGSKKQ